MTGQRMSKLGAGALAAVALIMVATTTGCTPATEPGNTDAGAPATGSVLNYPLEASEWEPLEITADSYPFGADSHANVGVDIAASSYSETEYVISGTARTYEAKPATDFEVDVLGESDYTTRALVRQPTDPEKWSGRVVVEYMNASDNMDLQIFWTRAHQQLMRNGDAYIGFTGKTNIFPLLRHFDQDRYGDLGFPSAANAETCGLEPADADYDPNLTSGDENGLLWDVWNQIGLAVKTGNGPLPGPATTVIAAGESQSAVALAKLYRWFGGDRATTADGTPIFDGYLDEDSPGWVVAADEASDSSLGKLNQCGDSLPIEDEQVSLALNPDRAAPYFAVHSQWGFWPGSTPSTNFRDWTITGANHVDRDMYSLIYPIEEDLVKAGVAGDDQLPWFAGAEASWYSPVAWVCPEAPEAPLSVGIRSAYAHLLGWIEEGEEPPVADELEVDDTGALALDEYGNAKGGLRLPAVDVPVATYVGGSWGDCSELIKPLDPATLTQLYGTDADYKDAYADQVDTLVEQGLILPEDGEKLVAEVAQWQIIP